MNPDVANFFGTYTPRLDDKGRLFLPAKFRERMADGLVVTRGQERCLYVFPMAEFVRVTEQMQAATLDPGKTPSFPAEMVVSEFTAPRWSTDGMEMRPCLSGTSEEAPEKNMRLKFRAA